MPRMDKQPAKESKPMRELGKIALKFPETEAGTSCNKTAYKARGKSFLFVGADADTWNAMFKPGDSKAEFQSLAIQDPNRYSLGKTGWATLTFSHKEAPKSADLKRWIEESFRQIAPKKLVAEWEG